MEKDFERFYLLQFIQAYDQKIELQKDCEKPDFICCKDGKVIGIEITNLKDESISKVSGPRKKMIRISQELICKSILEPIYLQVYFDSNIVRLTNKVINEGASYIYSIVEKNVSSIRSSTTGMLDIIDLDNNYRRFKSEVRIGG